MAQTVSNAKISVLLSALFQDSIGIQGLQAKLDSAYSIAFADGAGLNSINKIYIETRTLGAGASTTLDLAGVLLDYRGNAITFTTIKGIGIFPLAANTNDVLMGAAAATIFLGPLGGALHTIASNPGGITLLVNPTAAGWTVGAGATDFLKFANSGGGTGVTYDLVIVGA